MKKGISIHRFFTSEDENPENHFSFEWRKIEYGDGRPPVTIQVPTHWSDVAAGILARHYLRHIQEGTEHLNETSALQAIHRMAGCWKSWGIVTGYLDSTDDAQAFYDELVYMMLAQMAAPNSPQWFNTGVYSQYGIKGKSQGYFYNDPKSGEVKPANSAYEHPQIHACFIQSVKDVLVSDGGIMDLLMREAKVFKFGSGTGSNFSALRGLHESLESGGTSSGLVSFLKVGDRAAGAIRSGGTNRRAAKMVCVDVDHPDICEFIRWKSEEENKVRAMVRAGIKEQDAYATVSGQNSNNSVVIPDAFMDALKAGQDWMLHNRSDGSVCFTTKATDIWNEITEAAFNCGDPGLQFSTTINRWNTCKKSGEIRASNPCAEYLFLDDTACNLASINLIKFIDAETGKVNGEALQHAARLWTIVLDLSILMSQFPSKETAANTLRFRTLGLGFTGLGAMLMRSGVAYDSENARDLAASITALITGTAYLTSAEIAGKLGSFQEYEANRSCMQEVIRMHATAFEKIKVNQLNILIMERAKNIWHKVFHESKLNGFRNAQVTCIAPTGTIGMLMDAETTGIEPYFAPYTIKSLRDGTTCKLVNDSIEIALKKLGYDQDQVYSIIRHFEKNGEALGAPQLSPEHVSLFDTALPGNADSKRCISIDGHLSMMAAVQPLISGGISKTVNLPFSASLQEVSRCFKRAHELGLKCISIYRDGSKSLQPIQRSECCTIDH